MKILLTIPNAGYSGAEHQLLSLAIGLLHRGYQVQVCNLDGEGLFTEKADAAGVPVDVIHRQSRFDFKRLFRYRSYIRKRKFDLVISFTFAANNMTRIAKLFLPFRRFIHIAGERGRAYQGHWFANFVDAILARVTRRIIFNSEVQREKFLKHEWVPRSRTTVIHNGFDFERSRLIAARKPLIDLPDNTRIVYGVGNLSIHKNIEMYLKVMEKVTFDREDVIFVYVGTGVDLEMYRQQVHDMGLAEKCHFIGRQEDVVALLKSGDIFLLTSWWEGMPNVVIEAMAAGLPVVSTAIDGVNEIIDNGITGFFVQPDDDEAMAHLVQQLLDDHTLAESISRMAGEKIMPIFDMDKMITSYVDEISRITS